MLPAVTAEDPPACRRIQSHQAARRQHQKRRQPRRDVIHHVVGPGGYQTDVLIGRLHIPQHGVHGVHRLVEKAQRRAADGQKQQRRYHAVGGVLRHRLHGGAGHGGVVQPVGVPPHDHGDGVAGGRQIAALQRVIDLHGLVPQGLDRQDLPAHHTLQRQTQPRADQPAQPQQSRRDGGGHDDHRAPQDRACRPLTGGRFGADVPQRPLQHTDTFSNQDYRVGEAVGVAHQKVYAKADDQCRQRPHHVCSPPPCIVKI